MPSFDLVTTPWIPVVGQDGQTREVGLCDALVEAHTLSGITDPMPIVEFGLYRLLVAMVLDIFEPRRVKDLGELLQSGSFDRSKVDSYFKKYADRFDLFDEDHPFLQTPHMEASEAKPVAALLPAIPSGTNALHFHHADENDFAVCPAAAARLLTSVAPFMTAGGSGLSPSINGAPPWYVLVLGSNLFETLLLNVQAAPMTPSPQGKAPPAWRDERAPGGTRTQTSLLEALTWRPRRIQLIPGDGGTCSLSGRASDVIVRKMRFTAGDRADPTMIAWRDPSVPYEVDKKKGRSPMRPCKDQEVWRDTGPLALLTENDYENAESHVRFDRPAAVSQWATLQDHEYLPGTPELRIRVYGMRTKERQLKVYEWQRETLFVPAPIVRNGRFGFEVQSAMDRAVGVADDLGAALRHAYPRDGKGNKSALNSVISAAGRRYWWLLRPEYEAWLRRLAAQGDDVTPTTRAPLYNAMRRAARNVFDDAVDAYDSDADAIRRQVEARRQLDRALAMALATDEQRAAARTKRATRRKEE
jgi:CRISPR system Cascade subunit CasA